MHTVFIDGQAGTTGLQIAEHLRKRNDLELLCISEADRKNQDVKREYINSAEVVLLCLPDDAARESVSLIDQPTVRVLDASSAHRTQPGWVYGLPELFPGQRDRIESASRVSNPGCYPTGFLLSISPLVRKGIVPSDYPVTINAISGYSGGGRKLIERYRRQTDGKADDLLSCRKYGLKLAHKHLPEMKRYAGLDYVPLFEPAVADVEQGMLVSIPLLNRLLKRGTDVNLVAKVLSEAYEGERYINVFEPNDLSSLQEGFLSLTDCNGTNRVDLLTFGNAEQTVVIARLDNLGKGASGAAVQNLNLMLGIAEDEGLDNDGFLLTSIEEGKHD